MDGRGRKGNKIGDVLVAVVEIVGVFAGGREKDERAGGDGFRGIPNIGLEEDIFGAPELLDTEVVVVGEALEKVGIGRLSAHFDTAAHAVEGHRDHGVAGFPADGSVFGIVDDRPDTGLGLDERLVAVGVVLRHETVNLRVLVEIIGGVGLALGDGAVSDVVVGIGNFVCRD